jgi:hypothetical protein
MDIEERIRRLELAVDLPITRSLHGVNPQELPEVRPKRQKVALELHQIREELRALRSSG